MRKKMIVLWAPVVALCLPLASPVGAGEISGTGTIWAKGAGLAILRGNGEIVIRAHGVGIVWIKDANSLEASGRLPAATLPSYGAGRAKSAPRETASLSG
jgi:hypothetical protein